MGEEAKQEEAKAEQKTEEKKEEKEEKKEEPKPSPLPPIVLFVDFHCVGCAKKIERSIFKFRGVEKVEIDMEQNQVTVKGMVDPEALCTRIQKKTMRKARVISPLPPADPDPDSSTNPAELVPSQVSGVSTVELHVNMHCEACAQQLKRKILKMRGVHATETEHRSGKVLVTGTMNPESIVEYIYRRTGKLAKIIPPPPPPPPPPKEEEKKEDEEKKPPAAEEKPAEENADKKEEEKAPEQQQENTDGGGGGDSKEEKKEGDVQGAVAMMVSDQDDMVKKMMYWAPVYVIERIPPPQLFSDENPNACCIS